MVHADGANARQVSGERLTGLEVTTADVDRSALGELRAADATIERSAIRRVDAEELAIGQSLVGAARFERGTIKRSTAGLVAGRGVACDEVRIGILASPVVRGEVHTWLDLRTAVGIGLGMALGKAMLSLIGYGARKLRD